MANLKNITDLPVVESVEGLNLIVNDNGSAKQVPATAVGGSGGADWNAKEGEPGYVKNRTHYEAQEVVSEPLNITWDGNTEGLVSVGGMLFKVSDAILTDEQIKSSTVVYGDNEIPFTDEDWSDMVSAGNVTEEFVNLNLVMFVRKAGAVVQGVAIPETGIYFPKVQGQYVSSLTTTEPVEHTKTVVHKLDKKYLPDDVGGDVMFVNITAGENDDEYITDKTYEQITEALEKGIVPYCRYGSVLLHLVYSDALNDIVPYFAYLMHEFTAVRGNILYTVRIEKKDNSNEASVIENTLIV